MKKICGVLVVVFVLYGERGSGQVTWQKTYGSSTDFHGKSIIETSTNDLIVYGSSDNTYPNFNSLYEIKTNDVGDTLWTRDFSSDSCNFYPGSIVETFDHDYVMVGSIANYSACDILIIKTDTAGDTLWTKTYDILGGSSDNGNFIQQTSDSGFIIGGSLTNQIITSSWDFLIIKIDKDGNMMWSKVYGQYHTDLAHFVMQTNDGGFILYGTADLLGNTNNICLLKFNAAGNLAWSKTYEAPFGSGSYEGAAIENSDGTIMLTGSWSDSLVHHSVFLFKLNPLGGLVWAKRFSGQIYGYNSKDMKKTKDGGYIIVGEGLDSSSVNAAFLIKTDFLGDTLWTNCYGQPTVYSDIECISETTDSNYVFTGITSNSTTLLREIYFAKINANGNADCYQEHKLFTVSIPILQAYNRTFVNTQTIPIRTYFPILLNSGIVKNDICLSNNILPDFPEKSGIHVSPNPTTSSFTITSNFIADEARVTITDVAGRQVLCKKTVADKNRIEVELPFSAEGIYFVSVTNANGERANSKIAVVKE